MSLGIACVILWCACVVVQAQALSASAGVGYAGERLALDEYGIQMRAVQQQALAAQNGINAVTDSLIEANAVAEKLAERNRELKKQNELFGVSRVTGNREILEQRLLKSARDLALVEDKLHEHSTQLQSLVAALNDYLGAPESMKRDHLPELLTSLNNSERLLNSELNEELPSNSGVIDTMRVIDVREDLALVVVDAGKKQGLNTGMNLTIRSGARPIAMVRAVDVRDRITGCVIHQYLGDALPIEIGNEVRLDLR